MGIIAIGTLSFLTIQNISHPKYYDIKISGLEEEYNIGKNITGNVILEGYETGCGTLKIKPMDKQSF
jgi:hypothetical protein